MSTYETLGQEVGALVDEKQISYGNSFQKTAEYLNVLFPDGIQPEQYADLGLIIRMFDKTMRIANGQLEDSYRDLIGYSLLGEKMHRPERVNSVFDPELYREHMEAHARIYESFYPYSYPDTTHQEHIDAHREAQVHPVQYHPGSKPREYGVLDPSDYPPGIYPEFLPPPLPQQVEVPYFTYDPSDDTWSCSDPSYYGDE